MEEDGIVTIASRKLHNEITISVTDNGAGIAEEDLPHLCDPFFSRYLNHGGTGLGLFISKGILDDHNGTMEFVSELGTGTTVLLRFPYGGYD
jgi:polar amino acid transport system substrate-binding protein